MPHQDWCGKECADCPSPCALDESIPCSPNCVYLMSDGRRDFDKCEKIGCDAYEKIQAEKRIKVKKRVLAVTDSEIRQVDIIDKDENTDEIKFVEKEPYKKTIPMERMAVIGNNALNVIAKLVHSGDNMSNELYSWLSEEVGMTDEEIRTAGFDCLPDTEEEAIN